VENIQKSLQTQKSSHPFISSLNRKQIKDFNTFCPIFPLLNATKLQRIHSHSTPLHFKTIGTATKDFYRSHSKQPKKASHLDDFNTKSVPNAGSVDNEKFPVKSMTERRETSNFLYVSSFGRG
jgi:hypothetical protein